MVEGRRGLNDSAERAKAGSDVESRDCWGRCRVTRGTSIDVSVAEDDAGQMYLYVGKYEVKEGSRDGMIAWVDLLFWVKMGFRAETP